MKNILLLIVLALLSLNSVLAQDQGTVVYKFKSYAGYEREMELIFKDGVSKFIFHKDPVTTSLDGDIKFYHHYEYFETYYDFGKNTITEHRLLNDETPLWASWPLDLKWEITDESREILGVKAQKAIVKSYEVAERNSDWDYGDAIAWFTTEIPLPTGPERYVGLPGLILELEFSRRKSEGFYVMEINMGRDVPEIVIPSKARKIEVTKNQIIRPFIISKKWLKKQKEHLKSTNDI